MHITDRTFQLAKKQLADLNYIGPLGLSCDDTKLHPSLRLYWDKQEEKYFLVGGVDGPCAVADPQQAEEVLKDAAVKKATKVRTVSILTSFGTT